MFGKISITAIMHVQTGLHIGASNSYAPIGSVNNPIIRDSKTGQPMLPGSSLKGKMRYLLARAESNGYLIPELDKEPEHVQRLFGRAANRNNEENPNPQSARLQFADSFLLNADVLAKRGGMTEVKFENTISRKTALANPRQMERVVRGAKFGINMMYSIEKLDEIEKDFMTIGNGLKLLSLDYLGGGGSRGSGRISFDEICAEFSYLSDNIQGLDLPKLKEHLGGEHNALCYQ